MRPRAESRTELTRLFGDPGVCEDAAGRDGALSSRGGTVVGVAIMLSNPVEVQGCGLVSELVIEGDGHLLTNISLDCRRWPFAIAIDVKVSTEAMSIGSVSSTYIPITGRLKPSGEAPPLTQVASQ